MTDIGNGKKVEVQDMNAKGGLDVGGRFRQLEAAKNFPGRV
jgi:hypothetical protein